MRWRRGMGRWFFRWRWLTLVSFTALMIMVTLETLWVDPNLKHYFSQQGHPEEHQLVSRSRHYLQQALSKMAVAEGEYVDWPVVEFDLARAYVLFDIGFYHQHYRCTSRAVSQLNRLIDAVQRDQAPMSYQATQQVLPIIECMTAVEEGQFVRRSTGAAKLAQQMQHRQNMMLFGSLAIYILGIVFWAMHEWQHRESRWALRERRDWMQKAMRDPLTGAGNRHALQRDVHHQVYTHSAVILMDIDYFKQYNDQLGHPAGDQLLCQLADSLPLWSPVPTRVYRLGGDEFALLVDVDDIEALGMVCQELQEATRQAAILHPGHPDQPYVTLSIGASMVAPESFSEGYSAADNALYVVKRQGRNGWQLADSPEQSSSCLAIRN